MKKVYPYRTQTDPEPPEPAESGNECKPFSQNQIKPHWAIQHCEAKIRQGEGYKNIQRESYGSQ